MSVKKNAKHFLANAHGSLWSLRDVRSVQRSWAVESLMLHQKRQQILIEISAVLFCPKSLIIREGQPFTEKVNL